MTKPTLVHTLVNYTMIKKEKRYSHNHLLVRFSLKIKKRGKESSPGTTSHGHSNHSPRLSEKDRKCKGIKA